MKKILLTVTIILFCNNAKALDLTQYEIAEPYKAPEIHFSDAIGGIHSLSSYEGKVVLLNFWSTWCVPCIEEMPALDRLAKSMEGRDVVVLPLSIDFKGAEAVEKFYKEQQINNLPVYIDRKGKAFKDYKLQALPTSLIIDRHGKVTAKVFGAIEWDSSEAKSYLVKVGR